MNYDDIINLPHYESKKREKMSMHDRAAQFAPFAALTGHESAINETARLVDRKIELEEESKTEINRKLNELAKDIKLFPCATITYFIPDKRKIGGMYVTIDAELKKVDSIEQKIVLTDERIIIFDDIFEIIYNPIEKKIYKYER